MKPEQGKWYTNDWKGPTILIEYWNGSVERSQLRDARLDLCGKEYGIKRWCLLPEDTANSMIDVTSRTGTKPTSSAGTVTP